MHPMLNTKFQGHQPFGSGEDFFKGFYHIWAWRPSWSCDLDHLNKLSFPRPKEAPHEIWLQWAQWFQRRWCLKMLTTHTYIHTYERTTEAYLYYKLTNEPKGSGELKTNNNTGCQYIGCIGGHVTLSLRSWDLTSLRCQLSIWRTSTYRNVTC